MHIIYATMVKSFAKNLHFSHNVCVLLSNLRLRASMKAATFSIVTKVYSNVYAQAFRPSIQAEPHYYRAEPQRHSTKIRNTRHRLH